MNTLTSVLDETTASPVESSRPEAGRRPAGSPTPRAAVFAGPGEIRIEEVDLVEPGPGEVRVRLEGCGVCASNIPVWEGRPWFDYPMKPGAPGHEGWGIVDAVGEGVDHLSEGDRVAMLSYHAYATHDTAPAHAVVTLPLALKDRPFPGEPLGCAINIFKRSDIEAGQTVVVIGVGFLGALLTKLATHAGARVLAISRRPYSLEVAREAGAAECIPLDDHWKIIEQVKSLTRGRMCDRVIEATGKQGPLDLAGELTRERGRLMIAGYHQDGLRQVNMQLWNWRGIDVINAHEREPEVYVLGICDAVNATLEGSLDARPLFTHRFSLDELSEALRMTRDRPDGFMKALIMMG